MSVKFEKLKLPSYGQMGGVAFHDSDVLKSENPRVLIFGGQRQGISGALYSFEQASGDGYVLLPDGVEGAGPPPAPRTQSTLTAIGAEPQTSLILFAGYALNIGCVNDVWKCTISLDEASLPVPAWAKLETTGTAPTPRYGHSATYFHSKGVIAYYGGQDPQVQFGDLHLLAPETATWTQPSVSGVAPMARMKHSATAVNATHMLVFGGFNKKERLLDDPRSRALAYALTSYASTRSTSPMPLTPTKLSSSPRSVSLTTSSCSSSRPIAAARRGCRWSPRCRWARSRSPRAHSTRHAQRRTGATCTSSAATTASSR